MKRIFADSYYFIALLNERDAGHALASTFSRNTIAELVTTKWVLAEVADALSAAMWKDRIGAFLAWIAGAEFVTVCEDSDRWFDRGLALFRQRADKDWSLTDCISFAVMSEEGISASLTGDHHFKQAGFTALLSIQ